MTRRARSLALLATLPLCGCGTTAPQHPWRPLFDGSSLGAFVSTDFGGQGEVAVADGRIRLERGDPLTGVTWTGPAPAGAYELELIAARLDGSDFFCGLTFPVGDGYLTLVLGGWGGTVCGLSCLDGLDAARNETRALRGFVAGREYTVRVEVTPERVAAFVDGEPLAAASLAGRTCSLRPEVALSRPLGIASFLCTASIRGLRWRPLTE